MKQLHILYFGLFVAVTTIGCGPPRPQNMPETSPCKITVLEDGVPMPDVEVNLYRMEGNGAMSISAKTDSLGVANLQSSWGNYVTNGAPVGVSKLIVIKHFATPREFTYEELMEMPARQVQEYEKKRELEIDKARPVPKVLSLIETTPLEINIEKGKSAQMTVDISTYKN